MGKSKKRKKRAKRKSTRRKLPSIPPKTDPQSTHSHNKLQHVIRSGLKLVGWVGGPLAIVAFLLAFYPRLDVDFGDIVESKNPFMTPLIVKNVGRLNIKNINLSWYMDDVFMSGERYIGKLSLEADKNFVHILSPGEKTKINWIFPINMSGIEVERANTIVRVEYESIWPIHNFIKEQRYITQTNQRGELVWVPTAK